METHLIVIARANEVVKTINAVRRPIAMNLDQDDALARFEPRVETIRRAAIHFRSIGLEKERRRLAVNRQKRQTRQDSCRRQPPARFRQHSHAHPKLRFRFFLASLRRIAAPEFSRGFQPTGRLENISASRQRRLNSTVADATCKINRAHRGLKPTAKFRRRYAASRCETLSLPPLKLRHSHVKYASPHCVG